jgi:hypothetical protein
MERSTDDPDRRRNAIIEESRRGLRVGAGLCLGSTLGCAYSSTIGSTPAMVLFGPAVPVLGYQVWREYRLLRRLRRQQPDGADMGASVST